MTDTSNKKPDNKLIIDDELIMDEWASGVKAAMGSDAVYIVCINDDGKGAGTKVFCDVGDMDEEKYISSIVLTVNEQLKEVTDSLVVSS